MARRPYDLPPMTTLAAFEAAARHCSMKTAASELNVTPGAVSRQVKALEEELGRALFVRVHRGLELTPEGAELAETLALGFARAADVCRRLRSQTDAPSLTVGATTAFAGYWLIPRIGSFWQRHPEVTVNHAISDDPIDLRRSDIDLALRYGDGAWRGIHATRLFGDRLTPVCSPDFAARHPDTKLEDLPQLALLRMTGVDASWIDWDAWFAWAGLPVTDLPRRGRSLNNYTVVLQAARGGQGVALGWERLVSPMLDSGELVRLVNHAMPSPGAHYVIWDETRTPSRPMVQFCDWLQDQALA
ncbi:MAG: LysR substrate-binding domain-containing protein [Alphaproteobacteria bacterium]|nr:LysR substrate-binding domain-containing protein [Alphaproteobacteria bacterium]